VDSSWRNRRHLLHLLGTVILDIFKFQGFSIYSTVNTVKIVERYYFTECDSYWFVTLSLCVIVHVIWNTGHLRPHRRLFLRLNHHNVQGIQGAHERGGTAGKDSLHNRTLLADAPCSTISMATWLVRDRSHPTIYRTVPLLTRLPHSTLLSVVGHRRRKGLRSIPLR
jgi:hypothetical protein